MDSVETFLAYSIQLEQEAAQRFSQLADVMQTCGNREVEKLFRRLAAYSQLHLHEVRTRAGFREIPDLRPHEFLWPDVESPEAAAIWAADPYIGREEALQVALAAERASLAYYQGIHDVSNDPEVKRFAAIFVKEEAQHVFELEKWISAHRQRVPFPELLPDPLLERGLG